MHAIRRAAAASILSLLITHPSWAQQPHIADDAVVDAALAAKVATIDEQRATIERLLERKEVREIAARAGIDIDGIETAISTLDEEELAQLADQARTIDDALAGGQSSITISTTTIIIGLLLLILIIVAV